MSNFLNKIPVSPITSFGNPSVPNGSTFGTNFSILQTGGYMEVYTLSGLTYTIPPTTGLIEFSGNSIPIQLTKGSGSAFSPDVLTLNSDNISSGRRKLGMLAYVYETNKIYQFRIDNYDTLWNNATGATGPGGPTVVISDFGTTVKNNSAAGISFINAWTASTISGVGGYNDTNASWRVLSTGGSSSGGTSFTGGTVSGATNFTNGLTANTFSAGTYYNLPVSGVTGGTGISANTNNGLVTIVNTSPDQVVTITGGTNIEINGTYPNFGINFTGSTGISGDYLPLSGGTVTGTTIFTSGLTANTISATTYQNLPLSVITGTTNYIPKFTSGTTLTNSLIYDSFSGTGINTDTPIAMLDIKLSATTDYILNLKDLNNNEFFRINKAGGIFINTGATAYGAFLPTTPGIYINGDGSTSYGSNVGNRNIITFMQPITPNSISGIQASNVNMGNVRSGLYFQNNSGGRPELFGTTVVGGASVETFRITEGGSFNIGELNTNNSRFTIRNSRLNLGSKAFSILNSASTENVFINDNGNANFNGSLTSTTISATTYQNLPVSGVTGGTGISASSSNGLVTIVNTLPDQVVTISGGTGISTGGTYPNFVLTNTSPDQTVTITGGTNISVNGTYPNFGINFTGSTGASGDFLPLSGGTVTGGTTFTSGLTANTISATTYQGINRSFGVSFDGMGSVITVNSQSTLTIPYNMVIQSWVLLSDVSGSTVIDIWKDTYANYPPTSGDSITASAKPNISAGIKNQSSTLTGWNPIVNSGDIIRFNVDSCTGMTKAQLTIIGKEF